MVYNTLYVDNWRIKTLKTLNALLHTRNGDFNLQRAKMLNYNIAFLEDPNICDEEAKQLEYALKSQHISSLFLITTKNSMAQKWKIHEIQAKQAGIENCLDFEKYSEALEDCLFFDGQLEVIIFRKGTSGKSYFCGSNNFIAALTNTNFSNIYTRT